MYRHIAVGVDGSPYAATAEDIAIALAGRLSATVHGIHVIDTSFLDGAFITDISGAMGFEPFLGLGSQMRATLEEVGKAIRGRFVAQCETAHADCNFHLERAAVVPGILAAAKLADLILVGKRGVNARLHEDLLGPTTELLLRRSPIPVMVVPEAATLPTRPLVGYDGSAKAARALQHAAELCHDLDLPLTVVTVEDGPERAEALLAEAGDYLAPYGVRPTLRHVTGEKVEEELMSLMEHEGFDLLLLGAHGHSRIVELVLGSTSEFLARRAPVPVLCVTRA